MFDKSAHEHLLIQSYYQLLKQPLVESNHVDALWNAPFALVSHDTSHDPIFNYANALALALFEYPLETFTRLPSRLSAELPNQEERQRILDKVTIQGYVDDYSGVRISSTGKRFRIHHAIVWNVIDARGVYRGQAAMIPEWTML